MLLEECVLPGTPLREEPSLERRLAVFCSLYQGLRVAPRSPAEYSAYTGWVSRITDYMSKRPDAAELSGKINHILGILAADLHIPQRILRQCLYVETAMAMCWCVESGEAPEEFPRLLRTVEFAENLLLD